mgnify:CR=1 FL=1
MLNELIIKTMPLIPKPLIKKVATKYIAGPGLEDAVRVTKNLMQSKGCSTIDVLGEFVTTKEMALHEKEICLQVIDAIALNNLDSYPSLKPTSLGMGIDFNFGYDNIKELVAKANEKGMQICIDMENSPYTTQTLDLFRKLKSEGMDNVGIVIQAYMRRSFDDIDSVAGLKPFVRLCKGIYREPADVAFQSKEEVRGNYKKLLRQLFDKGLYVGIATHDEPLIKDALEFLNSNKIGHDAYEFQMLLGVREHRRQELLKEGHRLRVYVPFGEDWYGYATRRLKENPEVAGQIFKAMFFKN